MRTIAVVLDRRFELDGFDPSQVFALTFAEAKFNSLVSRGGTLSTPIKIAKTANNTKVLGFPDDVREQSLRPYTRYECDVRVDDQSIFYGYAVLEQSEDFYEMRIFGALSDFFETVGDKSIRELDLSAQNHDWTAANVRSATNASSNYAYPAINYGRWTGTKASRPHTDFFPATYFKLLLEKAATEEGWTLNNYSSDWSIPFSLQDMELEQGCLFEVQMSADYTATFALTPIIDDDLDSIITDPTTHAHDYASPGTAYAYKCRNGGTYDFIADIIYDVTLTPPQDVGFAIVDVNNSGVYQKRISDLTIITQTSTGTARVAAFGVSDTDVTNVTIGVFVTAGAASPTIKQGTSFRCVAGKEQILTGNTINLADTLPDVKIKDLYLFEAVRRNALIIANNQTKELEFITLDSIAAKWPIAKDWTDKVDYTRKPKSEYRLGDFAQNNNVLWKDGTDDDPAYRSDNDLGNYVLTINDGALPLDKDMYTAPFAASARASSFTNNVHVFIPRYSSSSVAYDDPDVDPVVRAMPLTSSTDDVVQIDTASSVTDQMQGFPVTWEEIAEANWTAFEAMLDRTKLKTFYVNLSATDIQELDVTIPVRIGEGYYMIREVSQWAANRVGITKVKLIRL